MGHLQKCYGLTDKFRELSNEARELYLGNQIDVAHCIPSPLTFLRDYVSQNKPLVIRGGCRHWPALKKWTNEYLRKKMGDKLVTVAITPNGYADAVCNGVFTLPEEVEMCLGDFLGIIERPEQVSNQGGDKYIDRGIYYLQKQNSSLTTEFSDLLDDVEVSLPWAEEVFGCKPDAINFWMGEEKAITSMHKDNYENIYCVIRGTKTFTILPPTDQPFIPYEYYPVAKYILDEDGSFRLEPQKDKVRWTPVDPTDEQSRKELKPYEVKVGAGDVLYLPSLWFHHVRQTQGCIAVNYWHDMAYDIKYNYFKFVESLASLTYSSENPQCQNTS